MHKLVTLTLHVLNDECKWEQMVENSMVYRFSETWCNLVNIYSLTFEKQLYFNSCYFLYDFAFNSKNKFAK